MKSAHSDRLMGSYWLWKSMALNDDGVITYKAPRGQYCKVFNHIEKRTGLDFKRVNRNPEIKCIYGKARKGAAGHAEMTNSGFKVITRPEYRGYHVEAHEIGHALGLGHVNHPNSAMTINWNYQPTFLSAWDLQNIRGIFDL